MTEETLRYWPKDEPIPEGWELVSDLSGTHHGEYAVLIRQTIPSHLEGERR
jgi:uncharacterized protein YbdZ (MbtH family)